MSDYLLHAPKGANKKKRRVGRGGSSGMGTTAGRGNKGQQSRSGGKVYVGFEGGQMPLYRRIARRGFSNSKFKKEYAIVNLRDIEARYDDGDTVSRETLIQKGVLKRSAPPVKVLGEGDITKKITVTVARISDSAKEKIEKAGGSATALETPEENDGE